MEGTESTRIKYRPSVVSLCLQLKNMPTDGMFGSDVSSVEDDGTASAAMVRSHLMSNVWQSVNRIVI